MNCGMGCADCGGWDSVLGGLGDYNPDDPAVYGPQGNMTLSQFRDWQTTTYNQLQQQGTIDLQKAIATNPVAYSSASPVVAPIAPVVMPPVAPVLISNGDPLSVFGGAVPSSIVPNGVISTAQGALSKVESLPSWMLWGGAGLVGLFVLSRLGGRG